MLPTLAYGAAGVAGVGLGLYGLRRWCSGGVCNAKVDLAGKHVVITGGNSGIGKEVAIVLAQMGAHVVIACRDGKRMDEAVDIIRQRSGSAQVEGMLLDLADTDSIHSFSRALHAKVDKLHLLINNAGVMACPLQHTKQGFELQVGTNHLGHFLLTGLLIDLLKKAAPSRVVILASSANYIPFWGINLDDLMFEHHTYYRWLSYGYSKLCNVMFARELNRRLAGTGVTANALHPGIVRTDLWRNCGFLAKLGNSVLYLVTKDEHEGAQTTLYAALSPELEGVGGKYLADCAEMRPNWLALDDGRCKKLWEESEKLLKFNFTI